MFPFAFLPSLCPFAWCHFSLEQFFFFFFILAFDTFKHVYLDFRFRDPCVYAWRKLKCYFHHIFLIVLCFVLFCFLTSGQERTRECFIEESHIHSRALSTHRHSPPAILSTWRKDRTTERRKIFKKKVFIFEWLPAKGWKRLNCILFWGTGEMLHQVVVQQDRGGGGELSCIYVYKYAQIIFEHM